MKKIFFVLLLVLSSQADAAQAFWTGRMESAQSVTMTWGWNCEYSYAGQSFWVFFPRNCPNVIQVE